MGKGKGKAEPDDRKVEATQRVIVNTDGLEIKPSTKMKKLL
jgi:hypothetical protein